MTDIILTRTAEKSLLKLPLDAKKKIAKAIEKIVNNPLIGEKLKGEYEGQLKIYAWPYRVIYIFSPEENLLTVVEIGHRQGVYK